MPELDKIRFCVLGDPKGQPRHRTGRGRVYDASTERSRHGRSAARAKAWKAEIALVLNPLLPSEPLTGPIGMEITWRFARPKSHYGTGKNARKLKASAPEYYTSKPDGDNLEKLLLDVCTRLRLWKDDAQVVNVAKCKVYVDDGYRPGMEVVVWQMNGCGIAVEMEAEHEAAVEGDG